MARAPGSTTQRRRVKTARQIAWNTLIVLKEVTTLNLEIAGVSERNARAYLRALYRAGYLRQVRPKQNGRDGGYVTWLLVRKTGPLAPMVRRDQSGLYDPNIDQLIPFGTPPEPARKERVHERLSKALSADATADHAEDTLNAYAVQ